MIVDERTTTYLNSLYEPLSDVLKSVEEEALDTLVPIIRPETQNLLSLLIKDHRPKRILEVGTAVGFSGILMLEAAGDEAKLVTIENYDPRIPIARENFKRAKVEDRVSLMHGDAMEILPTLEGEFDFVFMDAAKGQYINFLPYLKKLTRPGGLIVTDNVLQDGDIIESRFAVTRRNRTIHKRMRDYLFALTHDESLKTSILPLGDGVAITLVEQE